MFRPLILPTLLGAIGLTIVLPAAEVAPVAPAPEAPPFILTIPSGAALVTALDTSLYGRLWQDHSLSGLRDLAARWLTATEQRSGIAPLTLLRDAKRLTAQVSGLERDADGIVQPQGVLTVDLGHDAERVHGLLTTRLPELAIALMGDVVLLRCNSDAAVATPPSPEAGDTPAVLHAAFDTDIIFATLLAVAPTAMRTRLTSARDAFTYYTGIATYELRLVDTGCLERLRFPVAPKAPRPLDRALLAHLPGNTLVMVAQGINGKELWHEERESLLRDLREDFGTDSADETEIAVNEALKEFGVQHGIAEIIGELDGTVVGLVTPGAPLPGMGIIVPRSPALDDLIRAACIALEIVMPAEGATSTVVIPGVALPMQLTRDATTWVLTSDSGLALTWGEGKPGGWADSDAGRLALAKAGPDAFLIGASDTPTVLRLLTGLAAAQVNKLKVLTTADKRAVVQGFAAAATLSGTGYLVGRGEKLDATDTTVLEARGVLGFGLVGAFLTYLAVKPSADPQADNEVAAVAVLRNDIWSGEDNFQEAGHLDQDGDGTGEYGLLPELAGRPLADGSTADALPMSFTNPGVVLRGYHFALHLPDGAGGAVTANDTPRPKTIPFAAAQAQAQWYVAYAWPDRPEHGRRMFALTQDGDVYVAPFTGEAPTWNALFGGPDKGWDDEPAWDAYEE